MLTSDKGSVAALGLSRFGLGGRRGDRARIESDPRGAFLAELAAPDVAGLDGPGFETSGQLLRQYVTFTTERKERAARETAARNASAAAPGMSPDAGEMALPDAMTDAAPAKSEQEPNSPSPVKLYRKEVAGRVARMRAAELGYVERLVAFWTNHFAVSVARGAVVRSLAGAFEREAIRPHVLGRFGDMLLAATRHPAMLIYLDNGKSIGPDSPAGRRTGRGLNENHARELLELHTVGVNGGYDQSDVTSMARVLTGWLSTRPRSDDPGRFVFEERRHEPGAQTVMGKRYAEDGAAQGEAVLADLARSPATAAHIAGRLACAFVADDPPRPLVDRLTTTFEESDGDLAALARALVESDDAWTPPPQKLRSPQEFMFASLRALDVQPKPPVVLKALSELGQALWSPPSPKGYPLRGADWLAPNALVNRLDLSEQLAGLAGDVEPLSLAEDLLGGRLTDETRTAVRRAGSRAQGLALLLMSPEMQRT